MKLLVATPTRGDSPWLAETVASVSRCAPGAAHVLIAPSARCTELAARFPGVRVVEETGGGMYAAINAGVAAVAEWDAFTYINDDDLLLPGFGRILGRSEKITGAAMVYGGVRLIDENGGRLGGITVSRFPAHNRVLYALRLEPVYQHGTVVTRAAWERVGPFDATFRLCGDSEFLARLCVAGVRAEHVGCEAAAFRLRRGQLTKNRDAMEAERAKVDANLRLLCGVPVVRKVWVRVGFRVANTALYAERMWRHGFKRFDEVLVAGGQR